MRIKHSRTQALRAHCYKQWERKTREKEFTANATSKLKCLIEGIIHNFIKQKAHRNRQPNRRKSKETERKSVTKKKKVISGPFSILLAAINLLRRSNNTVNTVNCQRNIQSRVVWNHFLQSFYFGGEKGKKQRQKSSMGNPFESVTKATSKIMSK